MRKFLLSNVGMVMSLCSLLFISLLLQGCGGKKSTCLDCLHDIEVPLLTSENSEYPVLSSMFSSIDTVYLENKSPEGSILSLDEVFVVGDTIIIRSASTLFFFDKKGRFIRRFNRQGKGYGNYSVIDRFDILPDKDELYILDGHSSKVFVYDTKGKFKRQVVIDDFVTDFAVMPDGDLLFTNPMRHSGGKARRGLWRTDADGNFIKQLVEYDPEFAHVSINNPYLHHIGNGVIGFMGVEDNDKFYHYAGDTISSTCRMTTDIVIPNELKRSDKVFVNPEKEYTKCGYLETNRFLYFVATNYAANLVMTLVDKSNWNRYLMYVYTTEFRENVENIEPFPFFVGCYDGKFVGFYDSGMILDDEHYRKMFPNITAESNPVLIIYNE